MTMAENHAKFATDTYFSAQDRADAIDFVNRLNFAFDHWDLQHMVDAFTDDSVTDRPRGRIVGRAENIMFFENPYKPLTAGIRRVVLRTSWAPATTEASP